MINQLLMSMKNSVLSLKWLNFHAFYNPPELTKNQSKPTGNQLGINQKEPGINQH